MGVLMGYAGLCALWIPLSAWMMPNSPFRVGQVYLLTSKWRFEVRQRSGAGQCVGGGCSKSGCISGWELIGVQRGLPKHATHGLGLLCYTAM